MTHLDRQPPADAEAWAAFRATEAMASDTHARELARRHGLEVLKLTWEDTGRFKGSAVGPNISDMTIQVAMRDPRSQCLTVACMPVIRYPNFGDTTCDLDPGDFTVLVGNEAGQPLKRLSLYDLLADPRRHMTSPDSWTGDRCSLLADRDKRVLVSAQACFLPVPKQGKATFNPVLFNYRSFGGDPAALAILATREGTSMTVIDNVRDGFETEGLWGQRLFHNHNGERASLTGERESEFREREQEVPHSAGIEVAGARETSLNMVLLIQVPLKQCCTAVMDFFMCCEPMAMVRECPSDVENAVIGHGAAEGPFTEMDGHAIERDPRYPVRVTVQFYKATSNGVAGEDDMKAIKEQIDRVYAQSDYVGSLVTGGGTPRITEYEGPKVEPPDWWDRFWKRYEEGTGRSREQAVKRTIKLMGADYTGKAVTDLYLRDLLRTTS
jgi:hypothetical protein